MPLGPHVGYRTLMAQFDPSYGKGLLSNDMETNEIQSGNQRQNLRETEMATQLGWAHREIEFLAYC